jgi:hypothetical protein
MTAVSPLVFPGSRTLAAWWKQLSSLQPQALWVGHLLVHRVEALVAQVSPCPIDAFTRLSLKALELAPAATAEALESRLHLGPQVVRQLLRQQEAEGLVRTGLTGGWELTDAGRQALREGTYPREDHERRTFYFVESERSAHAPHFVNLRRPTCLPWEAPEGWGFEPDLLDACARRPPEWKQRYGFPAEVQQVLGVEETSTEAWQRVILDRPERLPVVLALTEEGEGVRLVGLSVQQEGWSLQTAEPVFVLGEGWQEAFPELTEEPSADEWRRAWQAWSQPRNLPAGDVDACRLERHGCRLRVLAPGRLIERLRAARSDALKNEAWLLAGSGRLRAAAVIELVARPV